MPIESEAPVSIRESLESAADQVEKVESAPIIEKTEVSSQQSQEELASTDVAGPVAGDPSTKGSATTSDDKKAKSITELLDDSLDGESTKEELQKDSNDLVDAGDHPDAVNIVKDALVEVKEKEEIPPIKVEPAPASWKGDAKKLWSGLPEEVRREVSRREIQTQQVLTETQEDRKRVAQMNQILAPHRDLINGSYGGNPMRAVNSLLGIDRVLTSGNPGSKAEVVAKIIQTYAIDLGTLDSLLAGGPPPPEVQQQNEVEQLVNQRIAPIMTYVQQQQKKEQDLIDQNNTALNNTIVSMSQDDIKYPHFQDVREDMADIIEMGAKRGIDVSLEQAYDKAIRMNGHPTPSAVTQNHSEADETKAALQAHQEAQKAKGASVSVSGNPTSVGNPLPKNTDIRSLLSDAMSNGGGRV